MLITIAGMIGGGKSSLTKIITDEFGGIAYYENANSPILQKFYTASKEEQEAKRYPFLLQLEFLNSRFKMIKKCLLEGDNPKVNTLDRSIYEDFYFMDVNHKLGRISDEEAEIYSNLLDNMLEEIEELPKKAPDLLIYLKGSYETFKHRIENRGRSFEAIDEETDAYFYELWKNYDAWVMCSYKASPVLVIDIDKFDYVNNEEDRKIVLLLVKEKLKELNLLEPDQEKGTVRVQGNISFDVSLKMEKGDAVYSDKEIADNLVRDFIEEVLEEEKTTKATAKMNKITTTIL